ncbi:MAG: hypothetical protein U0414_30750 [Polyangiaceae bacterium]
MNLKYFTCASLLGLTLGACSLPGSRASLDQCPPGEACSDETPDGLYLTGAHLGDDVLGLASPPATARGGSQTMTAVIGPSVNNPPYGGDFDAAIADNEVVLSVGSVAPPSVIVVGKNPGIAFLRLLEPGTDLLLDRFQLKVEAIDQVDAFPPELALAPDGPWAVLAGAEVSLVARLHSSSRARLVDEQMAFDGPDIVGRDAWDTVRVHAPASDFELQMKAGLAPVVTSKIAVVASIEDIGGSLLNGEKLELSPQRTQTVCFVARSGDANVAGAAWTFTTSGNVEVAESSLVLPSCVELRAIAVGSATLTASASGFQKSFEVDIAPSTMLVKPSHAEPRRGATGIVGERSGAGVDPR